MKCKLNRFIFSVAMFAAMLCYLPSCKKGNSGTGEQPSPTQPTLSVEDVSKQEGTAASNTEFTVRVLLNKASDSKVDVNYTVQASANNAPATAGDDFIASAGKLTFEAGETEKKIDIPVIADTAREQNEQFIIALSGAVNAKIGKADGLISINNDDLGFEMNDDGSNLSPDNYTGYNLVWGDEFSGAAINTDNWVFETGNNNGWGNNELEYYTDSRNNSFVYQNHLVIEAWKENISSFNYSSARIKTQDKKSFKYGRIDIRAKLPIGQGIWPALWMLGSNITSTDWPKCGEIDIMEVIGKEPSNLYATCHFGNLWNDKSSCGGDTSIVGTFDEAFHLFSIDWDENGIAWKLDGKIFHYCNRTAAGSYPYPFDSNFFFIFNVAVGGNWPGNPDANTIFPKRMVVDYVRVFQKQ